MAIPFQLDFFETYTESDMLKHEIGLLKESNRKSTKCLFAHQNALLKKILELEAQVDEMKKLLK